LAAGICEEAIFRGYLQKQFALRCSPEAPRGACFFQRRRLRRCICIKE